MLYQTIVADPPWNLNLIRSRKDSRPGRVYCTTAPLPYSTLTVSELCNLPVRQLAADGCHLWLWTTNQHLRDGFDVMDAWGFRYLAPITWVKPSGLGHWFVSRTQTLLFGYKEHCRFNRERYRPTVLFSGNPRKHSEKPDASYDLIEAVSDPPRLEMFARRARLGWDVWGNEVESDAAVSSTLSAPTTGSSRPVENREGFRTLDEAMKLLLEIKPSVPYARHEWHRRVEVVMEQTKFYPSRRLTTGSTVTRESFCDCETPELLDGWVRCGRCNKIIP